MKKIKIGTRKSPLALKQASEVKGKLEEISQKESLNYTFEIVAMSTTGDDIQNKPLAQIGGKGLFTKTIDVAQLNGHIDLAVHSMKDVPTVLENGLVIETVLARELENDAFLSLKYQSLSHMPKGGIVGTSSLRRASFIGSKYPHLKIVPFRGNVQTRLQKLNDGIADATILACAGLNRLDIFKEVNAVKIPIDEMIPAPAQGIIGIAHRKEDREISSLLAKINNQDVFTRMLGERAFLREIDGSCRTPISAYSHKIDDKLHLIVAILSVDGSIIYKEQGTCDFNDQDASNLGISLAQIIRKKAGQEFFDDLFSHIMNE